MTCVRVREVRARHRGSALAAAVLLALAACSSTSTPEPGGSATGSGGSGQGSTATTAPTATSPSAPTSPATGTPATPSSSTPNSSTSSVTPSTPNPGPMVVSPAGIGVLQVGRSTAAAEAAGMIRWDATPCEMSTGVAGWVAAGTFVIGGRPSFGFADDGPSTSTRRTATVLRIDVYTQALRTAEGIGIGASESALKAAYGPRLVAGPSGDFTRLWLLRGAGTVLVFEVMRAPRAGDPPLGRLVLMRIVRDRPEAIRPAYASGDIVGGCGL